MQFLLGLAMAFVSTILFCFGRAPWMMVIARAAQGFSASTVYLISLIIVADSVPPGEIGAWIGMVLSGMNLGLLVGPFLAGIIYARAGYYAVFGTVLGTIALDFLLRLAMIEKQSASQWTTQIAAPQHEGNEDPETSSSIINPLQRNPHSVGSNIDAVGQHTHETTPLLGQKVNPAEIPTNERFPTMGILLHSPRLMAAIGGAFTQCMLVTAFDSILPLFVHRTFNWGPTGGGLIFLAISIPSLLGGLSGALADTYGPKIISLIGFAIAIPSLATLSAVTYDAVFMVVLLCVLLILIGIGLSLILAPLNSDIYGEVTALAYENPGVIDVRVAFAQAYAMLNAAMGLACAVGPGLAGFFYETMGWQATAAALALMCALGGLQVFRFTGSNLRGSEQHIVTTV